MGLCLQSRWGRAEGSVRPGLSWMSRGQGESCGELLQHVPLCQDFSLEGGGETGWDLGPFATELQCLHRDIPLPEQQNIKKAYGTKNNPMHEQLGHNLTRKIQRDQNTQLPLLRSLEQKQGVESRNRVLQTTRHRPPPKW